MEVEWMRGSHRIIVQNKRIRYEFVIKRNLTILQGNSATGKTTLIEMIQEYYENGSSSGIALHADKECAVLFGRNWKATLYGIQDSIVFIDEGNEFIFTDEFASFIGNTDNYYVIVTREGIPSLPYSIEEIYGIRSSGKYGRLQQTYQEFYHLYHADEYKLEKNPNILLTEDSNSGYQFFEAVAKQRNFCCKSAEGKSNLFSEATKLLKENQDSAIVMIADGAAFGAEMEKMFRLLSDHKQLTLYVPESFEWLILQSGVVEDKEIKEILNHPSDYIDSQEYMSWERFFTALLIKKTRKSYLQYTKKKLNPVYQTFKLQYKILEVMDEALPFLQTEIT